MATVVLSLGCKKDTFQENIGVCPLVVETNPMDSAENVPINQILEITFNKEMNPTTISSQSITLHGPTAQVTGSVSYSGVKAYFTPTSFLEQNTAYTGSVKTSVKDVKGNALQTDYIWTFTTGVLVAPIVISTDPTHLETGVALNKMVAVTFNQAMNPLTINGSSFFFTQNGNTIPGSIAYAGNMASFTPSSLLLPSTVYTGTLTTDVENPAGTALMSTYTWTFTTASQLGPNTVDLACVSSFAVIAGSTVVNSGLSVIDGDLGLSPGTSVVGFPPGTVINGSIKINDADAINGKACLTNAFIDAADRILNVVIMPTSELGGLTLEPGLYRAAGGAFDISSLDLILDAQGDTNAVWIFQMPSSTLNVGNGVSVTLVGGASANNIYWQVGTSATIGTLAMMKGNIMADQSITMNTGAQLLGRLMAITGAVTLNSNLITKP